MAAESQILVELRFGFLTHHNAVDPALSSGESQREIGDGFQTFIGKSLDQLDEEETAITAAKPGQSVIKLPAAEAARWKERTAAVTESVPRNA